LFHVPLDDKGQQVFRGHIQQIIDVVEKYNGTYYLPYAAYPTVKQYQRSYPNYQRFYQKKAFAVFTMSSAITAQVLAKRLDNRAHEILIFSSIGMMIAMFAFPWVFHFAWVIVLQLLMGICNAMQKTSERVLLADHTIEGDRGKDIGTYHFWTSIASGFAVMVGGYLIDWLTIDVLFYMSAFLYGISAWMIGKHGRKQAKSMPIPIENVE
jgi:MFS family permease